MPPRYSPATSRSSAAFSRLAVVVATAAILVATLRSTPGARPGTLCIRCGETWLGDALRNVVLFLPLGVALAAAGMRTRRVAWMAALLSLAIESLQFAAVGGRYTSPLDVLSNTLGAVSGTVLWIVIVDWLLEGRHSAKAAAALVGLWWLQCFVTAWGLRPYVPITPTYYGQWAHVFPGYVPLPSKILDVRLHTTPVPDGEVEDTPQLQRLLRDSLIVFTVRTDGLLKASPTAQIAAITDGHNHRLTSIGMDDCTLRARAGTNSERIGLETPRIAFGEACTARATPVTIVLEQNGRRFSLRAETASALVGQTELALSPAIGWVMLEPLITSPKARRLITLLWVAAFALPVGLLSARGTIRAAPTTLTSLAVMLTGTLAASATMRSARPSTVEMLVLVGSVITGALVARVTPVLRPAR